MQPVQRHCISWPRNIINKMQFHFSYHQNKWKAYVARHNYLWEPCFIIRILSKLVKWQILRARVILWKYGTLIAFHIYIYMHLHMKWSNLQQMLCISTPMFMKFQALKLKNRSLRRTILQIYIMCCMRNISAHLYVYSAGVLAQIHSGIMKPTTEDGWCCHDDVIIVCFCSEELSFTFSFTARFFWLPKAVSPLLLDMLPQLVNDAFVLCFCFDGFTCHKSVSGKGGSACAAIKRICVFLAHNL